jgi:hypothetical protein
MKGGASSASGCGGSFELGLGHTNMVSVFREFTPPAR